MSWWQLLIVGAAAFIVWDFRRFRRAKAARQASSSGAGSNDPARPLRDVPVSPPAGVSECVSVILRRQVPPRFEAPRSWLGGLPMISDHVEWPRSVSAEHPEQGERPLHFLAQIACADLPAELWGGLGPRDGWLLLFVDPNQGAPEEPDAFRILHVDTLGPERKPPFDLGPVHDGAYTGPGYDYCRSLAEVPTLWRRWPVDLVVVANTLTKAGNRTVVAPDNFAEILYPGQRVAPDRQRPSDPEPFTWRGALYVLDSIERSCSAPMDELRLPNELAERLNQPGYIGSIIAAVDADDAKWTASSQPLLEGPEPEDETLRLRRVQTIAVAEVRRTRREALAAFLASHSTPDSIIAYLRQSNRDLRHWRAEVVDRVAGERSAVLAHDLDSLMPIEAWQALKARLRRDTFRFWNYHWVDRDGERLHVSFWKKELSADLGQRTGVRELVADYYVDAVRRSLIPPAVLAEFEPHWRSLDDNRPHRMGGYHDGVQSDARVGPASELLLFQIASDDAMHWSWGDSGAFYFFLKPDALKALSFSRAQILLECH
ncbi:DUF1963 domain-containing protein [Bradyrhizobium sp. LjRoot220]|uniref:DUF1963 domain-containing protein n=1 Tax=Bradyrhizobium sp. LjRoot220 TaxID=3342284 RepID=UPI003ECC595F